MSCRGTVIWVFDDRGVLLSRSFRYHGSRPEYQSRQGVGRVGRIGRVVRYSTVWIRHHTVRDITIQLQPVQVCSTVQDEKKSPLTLDHRPHQSSVFPVPRAQDSFNPLRYVLSFQTERTTLTPDQRPHQSVISSIPVPKSRFNFNPLRYVQRSRQENNS
jgi:hypothetical protein